MQFKKEKRIFAGIQILPVLFALLFPLYRKVTSLLPEHLIGCFFHDILFLYCPFCGGTRALSAVFSLDFEKALQYNALVLLFLALLLILDATAFVRLCRGKNPFFKMPLWFWLTLGGTVIAFGVARNLLMIYGGFDPLGDLLPFWQVMQK